MKVIELCGVPGCGKTTLGEAVLEDLSKLGYCAFNYNQIKEKKYLKNLKYLNTFNSWIIFLKLFRFGMYNRINKRTFIYSLKCSVVINFLRKLEKKGDIDFVLFDEGIIQYLTTLAHGRKIGKEINKVTKRLHSFYQNDNYYVFNCELDMNVNILRLRSRNRKGDRFLIDDEKEQLDSLTLKKNNISMVLDSIGPKNKVNIDVSDVVVAKTQILSNYGVDNVVKL